jgi:hypothetical protein
MIMCSFCTIAGCVITSGCAGGKGDHFGDVCGCVSTESVLVPWVSELVHNVISLWGQTYTSLP